MFVTTAETTQVTFTIETSQTAVQNSTATAGQVTSFEYPSSYQLTNETDRAKWIHLKAEGERKIIVYAANERVGTADTCLCLPAEEIDTASTYIAVMEDSSFSSWQAEIGIVAAADNTVLSITPTQAITVGTTSVSAGATGQITLNRRETLLLRSYEDLTGTRVESNKKISFFSGHECTNIPGEVKYCDFILEQLPPVQSWGTRYATAPLLTRTAYDRFRIVAGDLAAHVIIQCTQANGAAGYSAEVDLNKYEFYAFNINSTDFCWIEGTEKILLIQFSVGQKADNNVYADPFMSMVPPVDQYSNSYTLATVPSVVQTYTHYLNILIPEAFYQLHQIFLNGIALSGSTADIVSIKRYGVIQVHAVRVTVSEGVLTLSHANPLAQLGVIVYGFQDGTSYGYPGGMGDQIIGKQTYYIFYNVCELSARMDFHLFIKLKPVTVKILFFLSFHSLLPSSNHAFNCCYCC